MLTHLDYKEALQKMILEFFLRGKTMDFLLLTQKPRLYFLKEEA